MARGGLPPTRTPRSQAQVFDTPSIPYFANGLSQTAFTIATGFSAVSAAFMIIVARPLNLMEHWNFYFWSTLVDHLRHQRHPGAHSAHLWHGSSRGNRCALAGGQEPLETAMALGWLS
jgi:hypothetical protein